MLFTRRPLGRTNGFDAQLQIAPNVHFEGTSGRDVIRGSSEADYIDVSQGGKDKIGAGFGDDTVYFGAAFTAADRVVGGAGFDTVILDGDYSAGLDIHIDRFAKIERLVLEGGSYVITGDFDLDYDKTAGSVDGSRLLAGQSLHFEASSAGKLEVVGGAGDDVLNGAVNGSASILIGLDGDDVLIGRGGATLFAGALGADRIEMAGPADVAFYGSASESIGRRFDTIENFAAAGGRIELGFDSDSSTSGIQFEFHLGRTADRTGDILFKYDAGKDETVVKVFTDHDKVADFVLHLTGDVPLTTADFIFG